MQVRVKNTRLFAALLVVVIALAWLVLWVWGQSPYGRFLNHEELEGISFADEYWALAPVFVVGWTVMTFAMMLPTSLPLIALFHTITRERRDHTWLVTLLIAGYLGTWMLFGIAIHLGDLGLHDAIEQIGWLGDKSWVLGAGTLMLAGVYQFTPLKYQCLDKCRSPLSFIMEHWRGKDEQRQSLWLGIHHGIFCIGCCWSLMLLMFAVGVGNIGWMLVLGTVMAIEKNMPWGRRLSKPLGAALLGLGAVVAVGFDSRLW